MRHGPINCQPNDAGENSARASYTQPPARSSRVNGEKPVRAYARRTKRRVSARQLKGEFTLQSRAASHQPAALCMRLRSQCLIPVNAFQRSTPIIYHPAPLVKGVLRKKTRGSVNFRPQLQKIFDKNDNTWYSGRRNTRRHDTAPREPVGNEAFCNLSASCRVFVYERHTLRSPSARPAAGRFRLDDERRKGRR